MEIFVFKIKDYENLSQEYLKSWQKKEISNPEKFREHTLAYYLAEKTAQEFYGFENCKIVYKGKKPVLENGEKEFSISHSKDFIALAFSDFPCGIDIEKMTDRDFKSIAERMKFECPSLEAFYGILTTYAKNGGASIHFNVFNAEMLIDAQKHPENYKNLQVRVCGWNVLWNNLVKEEQDAYIQRALNIQ